MHDARAVAVRCEIFGSPPHERAVAEQAAGAVKQQDEMPAPAERRLVDVDAHMVAGDVDVLLLDKTGTITLGNRQAVELIPAPNVPLSILADAAQLGSLADETPEGRSIVVLAKEKYGLRGRAVHDLKASFIPFSAQTRISGVNLDGRQIRKGAADAITPAPVRRLRPAMIAWRPSSRMLAPMRINSCACMKRFSKIVSVTIEMPSACVMRAMYCAWRSVANPGNSSVVISAGRTTPPVGATCKVVASVWVTVTPASGPASCIAMLMAIYVDLLLKRLHVRFLARPIIAVLNWSGKLLDRLVGTDLRPGEIHANYHVVADAELLDTRSHGNDRSRAFQAKRVARHGAVDDAFREHAHGLEHVLEIEAGGAHANRHLARTRLARRFLDSSAISARRKPSNARVMVTGEATIAAQRRSEPAAGKRMTRTEIAAASIAASVRRRSSR